MEIQEQMIDPAQLISQLNPAQQEAVKWEGQNLLILAGAGSGKTRTLTYRIAYGVCTGQVAPFQVMAVTFSNRAAQELRHRIEQLLYSGPTAMGPSIIEPFLGITFHAMGLRILRAAVRAEHPRIPLKERFTIYDDDDQKSLLKRILAARNLPTDASDVRSYAGAISWEKSAGRSPAQTAKQASPPRLTDFPAVYLRYNQTLRQNNAVDFGDLLCLPVDLLREDPELRQRYIRRYPWVLVDEFQDTNTIQMALIRLLTGPETRLSVVGDDDQSIYRWRGAQIQNILGFPDNFEQTHVIKLEQNYRSTGNILGAANAVIARNEGRHPKELWTAAGDGAKVAIRAYEDDRQEARTVINRLKRLMNEDGDTPTPWHSHAPVAIFYRTHAQSLLLEEALRLSNLPYRVYGGMRFYDRKEIKDVLAYARILENPDDNEAFLRIVNFPARGIGKVSIEKLVQRADTDRSSLLESATAMAVSGGDRVSKKLIPFVQLLGELQHSVRGMPAGLGIEEIIEQSGLKDALERDSSTDNVSRLENIAALVNAAHDFAREASDPTLASFLEGIVLRSQTDDLEAGRAHVALMTLHNAKGLEFDHVFMVGVEENLLPHVNSRDPDEIEEERRLLYVGMTRARKTLEICYARRRQRYGSYNSAYPSYFLDDLPDDHVERSAGQWHSTTAHRPAPKKAGHWADDYIAETTFEPDPQPGGSVVGRRVSHATFGAGRIRHVAGNPGPNSVVVVDFTDGVQRKIIARFLEPQA